MSDQSNNMSITKTKERIDELLKPFKEYTVDDTIDDSDDEIDEECDNENTQVLIIRVTKANTKSGAILVREIASFIRKEIIKNSDCKLDIDYDHDIDSMDIMIRSDEDDRLHISNAISEFLIEKFDKSKLDTLIQIRFIASDLEDLCTEYIFGSLYV